MSEFIALPIVSLLLGFSCALVMSRCGQTLGLIDNPNERSSHTMPTASGGGIGIPAALVLSAVALQLPLYLWLPAALLSLVGFLDDRINLSLKTRIIFQFAAALATVLLAISDNTVNTLSSFSIFQPTILTVYALIIPLCVFIAGTANFFNFMDGINGIAGIAGTVAFGFMALFAHIQGCNPSITLFAVCIAAACLGFLPLNFPCARVFMGDGASTLLGFAFATLALTIVVSLADFLVLCGFLFTFYADTLTTLYVRWRDREQLTRGHRRHLYQLLANQMKIPHWQVSLAYGLIQAAIGGILLWLRTRGVVPVLLCELILFGIWCWAGKLVRNRLERG